ncbi:serine/threonine protein kinase [Streptomyces sp. NBC_01754]|uniref:serine/threonine-protein kinase n=1 Tax=Streptomyces sp. NBC_01754 TaxID=2975930 RepID=UPI002DDC03BE|nr:serine/threonine-protein kinase [Streptomyces sp. NBC_01754]WSC94198.1 serine/threonine protein kinase [Streptomyces sp. NBC_01754]
MQPLEAGEPRTVGAYRLIGRLGAGGMGRVYLGRSAGGRTVAVKVVHPHFALDEQFRARFRREVEAARRVGARWTAPVLDADPDAPVPWVATGYVAGPPLAEAVTRHGPLPEHTVRVLGSGLGEALAAVHGHGLIHRDVKPSNVLLALDGPRLIDFGIARALGATVSLTSTGVSVGSPGYMAPEQIRGLDVSGAADVFSLGAVLAYAATGCAPFPGDSSAVLLYKVVHEEPELGDLEGELRELVTACLAKRPGDRPAPAELARRLAPGGAAVLVGAGWLPDPLVREVSRSAVALLDLEPQDDPVQSGPVPFSSASLGSAPRDGFGPPVPPFPSGAPDPGPASTGAPGPGAGPSWPSHAPAPYSSASSSPSPYPSSFPPAPGPTPAPPPEPGAAGPDGAYPAGSSGEHRPGIRAGVSLGTGTREGGGRGRRVSCTVALAVTGAVAAVTVGATMLNGLLPGGDDDRQGNQGAAAPSATGTAGPVDVLPEEFVGTWQGTTVERNGSSHGTVTAVFTDGAKGEDVVRLTYRIDVLGTSVVCKGIGRFVAGTATELKVRERTDPDHTDTLLCTGGDADVDFTLDPDGTLRYQSHEDAAGTPKGRLTRSGG